MGIANPPTPTWLKAAAGAVIAAALLLALNWAYWVIRKPSELLFPLSGAMNRAPAETWDRYGALFERYSTATLTPAFLAALAQAEGAGNPLAHTYWRISFSARPFDLYRPASSSVGLYQMTDGTFHEARHYCIRDHRSWRDARSNENENKNKNDCGSDRSYLRIVPEDAIELTSAYLDWHVTDALSRHGRAAPALRDRQHLAAVIHLCGAGAAEGYVRRRFRLGSLQRCGAHPTAAYLARLDSLVGEFAAHARLARRE